LPSRTLILEFLDLPFRVSEPVPVLVHPGFTVPSFLLRNQQVILVRFSKSRGLPLIHSRWNSKLIAAPWITRDHWDLEELFVIILALGLRDFSCYCGFTTNIRAELHAIHKGLELAWNLGFRIIDCESDSLVGLNHIAEDNGGSHAMAAIINLIRSFKDR